jgi:hypothetical protein
MKLYIKKHNKEIEVLPSSEFSKRLKVSENTLKSRRYQKYYKEDEHYYNLFGNYYFSLEALSEKDKRIRSGKFIKQKREQA